MALKARVRKSSSEPAYILNDLDKPAEIAFFYGFTPVKTPRVEKRDLDFANTFNSESETDLKGIFPRLEEKISLLRLYADWGLNNLQPPVMIYYRRPFNGLNVKRNSTEYHGGLDIIGSNSSISEAIAIKTVISILSDHGYNNLNVDINSIGDKDSIVRFERGLINYFRKNSCSLPQDLKKKFRKDPFSICESDHEAWKEFKEKVPQSLGYLSEPSVNHFQEVLEYLETNDIPYQIQNSLTGNRQLCSHTLFQIKSSNLSEEAQRENEEETVLAFGSRHNNLARKIGFKKDLPIVSINFRFKKPAARPRLYFRVKPRPKFYFIQFGSIAKLKSLPIIELLRQAKIPVYHSLTRDKFIGQLSFAESLKTPFVIIMGQKEALENTVVVRQMTTRSQDIVPVPNLAEYLSKLS